MPPTASLSRMALSAILRQGIRPACPACLSRLRQSANTLPLSKAISQQTRYASTAATKENIVEMNGGPKFAKLKNRDLMRVAGNDAADLIQGLVANDVNILDEERVMYTMFLSSAGRVLYDVMVYRCDEAGTGKADEQCFLIECDKSVTTDLQRHLTLYRVRKQADISYFGDKYQVWGVFDPDSKEDSPRTYGTQKAGAGVVLRVDDPRIKGFAQRIVTAADVAADKMSESLPECQECPTDWYTVHRYRWGVPEGVIDLPPSEALPLESNLAFMNGVSFTKGCYLGQELTARTHHTGVIRKRIMPIEITGGNGFLTPGSIIHTPNGKDAGRARGHLGQYGLGLMRVNISNRHKYLRCADTKSGGTLDLEHHVPGWFGEETVKEVVKRKQQN